MLAHPTHDQLRALGLHGMAKAFGDLAANPEADTLGHGDWLALLLDRETVHRQDKRLGSRLLQARLRHQAAPEDIDYRAQRGLDRALLKGLIEGDWIGAGDNLVITGPTGVGKSWLACALGHKACRDKSTHTNYADKAPLQVGGIVGIRSPGCSTASSRLRCR